MANQIWLFTIHSSAWLVSRSLSHGGSAGAAGVGNIYIYIFFNASIFLRELGETPAEVWVKGPPIPPWTQPCLMTPQYKANFPWVRAKEHVSKHACQLIQHAVEVGKCVVLWGEAGMHRSAEHRESRLAVAWGKERMRDEQGEMTKEKEQRRTLTLRKLECGVEEQPPWMCCTQSVLGLVGGLLCTLLLHWLLDRENLVLETEKRKWCPSYITYVAEQKNLRFPNMGGTLHSI